MKSAEKKAMVHAVAMKSMESFGKRNANRDTLTSGGSHDVKLKITGKIDGEAVSIPVIGTLSIADDNPTGSTKRPSLENMLCAAFATMAKTRRERLVKLFEKEVPEPCQKDLALVKALVASLSTKSNKRGAVTFQGG